MIRPLWNAELSDEGGSNGQNSTGADQDACCTNEVGDVFFLCLPWDC